MVKLPLSTEASNKLIAFLYGFELEADTSLEVIKELIFYGGVCGVRSEVILKKSSNLYCMLELRRVLMVGTKVSKGFFV